MKNTWSGANTNTIDGLPPWKWSDNTPMGWSYFEFRKLNFHKDRTWARYYELSGKLYATRPDDKLYYICETESSGLQNYL